MYQDFYRGHDLLAFPIFALILFMLVFLAGALVAWRRVDDAASSLPLFDDTPASARHPPSGDSRHV